jgi:hypothetical protein
MAEKSDSLCEFNYLKPINYDDLFDDSSKSSCTNYQLVLDKLTQARLSFFSFQAGIYNFIKDCSKLQKKMRSDISGNDLISMKYEYSVLINNLISNVAVSLRKRLQGDENVLINFEVPMTMPNKNISDMKNLESTNIVYSDKSSAINTLITTIPSVCLYLNSNMQLQVKIVSPSSVSYNNLSYDKIYIKSFSSKLNDIFEKNLTPELDCINIRTDTYGFRNAEHAHDILEDIVNYDDDSVFSHNLNDVITRIDSIITGIENTHRTIVQQLKAEQISKK